MISIKNIKEMFNLENDRKIIPVYQIKPVEKCNNTIIINKVGTISRKDAESSVNNIVHSFEIEINITAKVISVLLLSDDFKYINTKNFYPILKLLVEQKNITIYYAFLPDKSNTFKLDTNILGKFSLFVKKNKITEFIKTVEYINHDRILEDMIIEYFNVA